MGVLLHQLLMISFFTSSLCTGLDQTGFLRDTNFLVPWDIPVPKGSTLDGHAWPSPSESGGGGRKGGKHRDKRAHKGMYL